MMYVQTTLKDFEKRFDLLQMLKLEREQIENATIEILRSINRETTLGEIVDRVVERVYGELNILEHGITAWRIAPIVESIAELMDRQGMIKKCYNLIYPS